MLALLPYERAAAVRYAHLWAYGRNPRYYDYESIGAGWQHSPVVVAADRPRSYADILVAAHSFDADDRPLSTYEFVRARFLHIGGVYRQG